MMNPIQLCDVAKLHQQDVEREIALKQDTNQVQKTKFFRLGKIKRFVMLSFTSHQKDRMSKTVEVFSR